jgi:hypothetical protein
MAGIPGRINELNFNVNVDVLGVAVEALTYNGVPNAVVLRIMVHLQKTQKLNGVRK